MVLLRFEIPDHFIHSPFDSARRVVCLHVFEYVCSVTVRNVGGVEAAEVIMLFARPLAVPNAPQPLPQRQLFDFGRTPTLTPGIYLIITIIQANKQANSSTRQQENTYIHTIARCW